MKVGDRVRLLRGRNIGKTGIVFNRLIDYPPIKWEVAWDDCECGGFACGDESIEVVESCELAELLTHLNASVRRVAFYIKYTKEKNHE